MVCAVSAGSAGIDGRRADRQVHQLTLPVDLGLDQAAARTSLDHGISEFLLRGHELILHLLRGRQQLLHVHLAAWVHCDLTRYRQPAP